MPSLFGATAFLAASFHGGVALTNLGAGSFTRDDPRTQPSASSIAHDETVSTLPFKQRFTGAMCGLLDGQASHQRDVTKQRKEKVRMSAQQGETQPAQPAATTEEVGNAALRASSQSRPGAPASWNGSASPLDDLCQLTDEQIQYAKCPPGDYMTDSEREVRELRLLTALCITLKRGWVAGFGNEANQTVLTNEHYKERGYMTYESTLWPKPGYCPTMGAKDWRETHPRYAFYRPDFSPINYQKLQCSRYSVDFLKSWKVASTTFPEYLECEYAACSWEEVPVTEALQPAYKALTAVRDPLSRWISGASELLERAVNGYCPNGPCTADDGYVSGDGEGSTADRMRHQTSWYQLLKMSRADYSDADLVELVKAMVTDTKCNLFTYASEHLSTQSNFATQNSGRAARLSYVMKLEDADEGLNRLSGHITGSLPSGECSLVPANVKDCKPGTDNIPSDDDFFNVLEKTDSLMQEICLVYAQDFACFDYELPELCKGMY